MKTENDLEMEAGELREIAQTLEHALNLERIEVNEYFIKVHIQYTDSDGNKFISTQNFETLFKITQEYGVRLQLFIPTKRTAYFFIAFPFV